MSLATGLPARAMVLPLPAAASSFRRESWVLALLQSHAIP